MMIILNRQILVITLLCGFMTSFAFAEDKLTIEEKLSACEEGDLSDAEGDKDSILSNLKEVRKELQDLYESARILFESSSDTTAFVNLLGETKALKGELISLEKRWRETQSDEVLRDSDAYGVWQHGEATIGDLVIEYGSLDSLYIIPPELMQMKLTIHSSLMIPKESWSALLDAIFKHNGIGVRSVNSYTKQLYLIKQDNISVSAVLTSVDHLNLCDRRERVAFLYAPTPENLKQVFYFIERLRDQKSMFVYQAGSKIAIIGFVEEIKKIVTLCESVWDKEDEKTVRVVTSSKFQSEELVKLLRSFFGSVVEANRPMIPLKGGTELAVMPISHEGGVVLIGSKLLVERAEAVIRETEMQVNDPYELTVFWYTCSHTSPDDLAGILEKVYFSLLSSSFEAMDGSIQKGEIRDPFFPGSAAIEPDDGDGPFDSDKGWPPAKRKKREGRSSDFSGRDAEVEKPVNFIPYPSTGSILMVIRKDMLSKIKEVIKKLDSPKRMVEIEVLLVERRVKNNSSSGVNVLRIGSTADHTSKIGGNYYGDGKSGAKGLFEFIISRDKTDIFPAIDLSYNFLLAQEDIRVTAAPSVITINQTPATISVTDQISISNGASPVDTNGVTIFKDSFERADFGITIKLTPTVHEPEIDDLDGTVYVTLENDISFETIKKSEGSQSYKPDVHKRQVKNQVRIADGQTVILGGLRNKSQEDRSEKIPFLGEIPGLGKLFGTNALSDTSGEMFIFIKPKVIHDPKRDLIVLREERLKARPGDSQLFLDKIKESRKKGKDKAFKRSFDLLFGVREDGTINL